MSRTRRQGGFSLLLVLIVIGVVGALAVGAMHALEVRARAARAYAFRSDLEAIKRTLAGAIDCKKTRASSACPSGALRELYRPKSTGGHEALVTASGVGKRLGRWTVRAECAAGGAGYVVRRARLSESGTLTSTAAGDFLPDPVSGQAATWTSPSSLVFDEAAPLCAPTTQYSGPPLSSNACDGTNHGGWCQGMTYREIEFAKPFARTPRVIVTLSRPITQTNDCGWSTDRTFGYADRVTTKGFRMYCGASPLDMVCPTVTPWAGMNLFSSCQWVAFEP